MQLQKHIPVQRASRQREKKGNMNPNKYLGNLPGHAQLCADNRNLVQSTFDKTPGRCVGGTRFA